MAKRKGGGVPPSFENVHQLPGMQGARILQQPEQNPRTLHTTAFRGTETSIAAVLQEDDTCIGYVLSIHDKNESHRYVLHFDQLLFDSIFTDMSEMPRVGQKAEEKKSH